MGHLVGKDVFRKLGIKIDGMETRAPWNDKLHAVLKELYTPAEAEVVIKMPYGLATIEQLEKVTGYKRTALRHILDGLTQKGLVLDIWINDAYHFAPSPLVVGIFEFTMMRVGPNLNTKEWAKLLSEYMDRSFFAANFGQGEQFSIFRALPYEEAVKQSEFSEVLDYEKASMLIAQADKFSIGLCSCRHEKMHLGEKSCDVPLESCSQFGYAAEMMIRHNLAREVSRSEMEEHFARSRETGLVLTADNVQKNMKFVCHCCGCCCNLLKGISHYGYPNIIVTSSLLAEINDETCTGCGKCAKACPINAITMSAAGQLEKKRKQDAGVNTEICLGCGVCALKCPNGSLKLAKREQSVIHPETTFERIMLQCLEKGTLQNQIFADPGRIDQKFMRAFVGAFLRLPPVKKALLSDKLRSGFLNAMKDGVKKQGKDWVLDM
ncbi:MAG: 4Fe-4S binding protein [Geobacteraceae bacterium]|nr:4Fe-4S binding protein [Geobacteraceae bacterium]